MTLPGVDATALLADAVAREGVSFVPGTAFVAGPALPAASESLRLNFSQCDVDQIAEGIGRLSRAVYRALS